MRWLAIHFVFNDLNTLRCRARLLPIDIIAIAISCIHKHIDVAPSIVLVPLCSHHDVVSIVGLDDACRCSNETAIPDAIANAKLTDIHSHRLTNS